MQFGVLFEKLGCEIEQFEFVLEELEMECDILVVDVVVVSVVVWLGLVCSLLGYLLCEDVVYELVLGICICLDCGGVLCLLGIDVYEMFDIVLVCWWVVCNVCFKYSCWFCEKIVQVFVLVSVVVRGKVIFVMLVYIVVLKFDYYLLFY